MVAQPPQVADIAVLQEDVAIFEEEEIAGALAVRGVQVEKHLALRAVADGFQQRLKILLGKVRWAAHRVDLDEVEAVLLVHVADDVRRLLPVAVLAVAGGGYPEAELHARLGCGVAEWLEGAVQVFGDLPEGGRHVLVGAGELLESLARLPRVIHLIVVGSEFGGGGDLLLQELLAHQLRETPAAPGVDDHLAAALIHRIARLEVRLHGVLHLLLVLERDEDVAVAAQVPVARDLARRDAPAARKELRL